MRAQQPAMASAKHGDAPRIAAAAGQQPRGSRVDVTHVHRAHVTRERFEQRLRRTTRPRASPTTTIIIIPTQVRKLA